MLVAFFIRGNFIFFALAAAFLTVYIFTLVGLLVRRQRVVTVFENGLHHANFRVAWDEIVSVNADKDGLTLVKSGNVMHHIPRSMTGFETILKAVRRGVESQDS